MLSWLSLAIAAAFMFALRRSRTARDLYAAGGNPEAANYSGIDAGRMQFIAYTICGAIAGVCGYLWVARFAVAYTDIALGFELSVIAACLIGGVAIAGGAGIGRRAWCSAACSSASFAAACRWSASRRSGRCSSTAWSSWSRCCLSARQREFKRTILEARA